MKVREREKQTERKTTRQTNEDKLTDRQTGWQTNEDRLADKQTDRHFQTNEDRLTDKQHGNHYHMVFPQWNRSWSLPSVHSIRKPSFCWTHCGLVSVSSLTCQLGTPVYVNKANKTVWTKQWIWASSLICQLSMPVYVNKETKARS